jgi:hypothetical protein
MNPFAFAILIFTSLFALNTSAQDYLDKIAIETCNCAQNISGDVSNDRYMQELGVCMFTAAKPYQKQLKKDFKIDYNNVIADSERLGELIGMRMAFHCPDYILELASKTGMLNEEPEPEANLNLNEYFEGTLIKVDRDQFLSIQAKDFNGKTVRFYWLWPIQSPINPEDDFSKFLNEPIELFYEQHEFFDPKIGEYRTFNVLVKINRL